MFGSGYKAAYVLDGSGSEIPALKTYRNAVEILITGTATAVGNYAIGYSGTPNIDTTINVFYKGSLDITTNGVTFSILGQSFNQNDLDRELEITFRWTGAAWAVITKKDFKETGIIEVSHMSSDSVATAAIQDDAVTTDKIADLNVTTIKIAADAVDKTKINADVAGAGLSQAVGGELDVNVDNSTIEVSADAIQVKDLGITTTKINDLAVTTGKIADLAVTTAKINDNAVTTVKVLDNNITNAKLAQMPTLTVKANITGGTANAADVTIASLQPYFLYQLYKENPSSPTANTVIGLNSFAIGSNNTVSGTASGSFGVGNASSALYSFSIGRTNVAQGQDSFVAGYNNDVSGQASSSFGDSNTVSGDFSTAIGRSHESSASYTTSLGRGAFATREGEVVSSSGNNAPNYYSQKSQLTARVNTTNATPDDLYLDGTSSIIDIATNSLVRFKGTIVSVQYAGASGTVGDSATFDFYGTIKNVAGTTALVDSVLWMDNTGTISSTPAQSSQDAAAAAWAVAITADNTNDALQIEVTGEANKSIYWHCVLELNEIKYAA